MRKLRELWRGSGNRTRHSAKNEEALNSLQVTTHEIGPPRDVTPRTGERYRLGWDEAAMGDPMSAVLTPNDGSAMQVDGFDECGRYDAENLTRFFARDAVVLDVGCGMGRIEKHLAAYCRELHAVDVSPLMIEKAKVYTQDIPNIHFYNADATDLSALSENTFDFCFSYLVLQHVEYEDAFLILKEILRVLKPGAIAFLQFPHILCEWYTGDFVRQAVERDRRPTRVRPYTQDLARFVLEQAGFQVQRIEIGLDGIVTENEIGVIAGKRPAAGS